MRERYEKQGSSVRMETSTRGTSRIALREGGWSETSDGRFSCGPMPPRAEAVSPTAHDSVRRITASCLGFADAGVLVERLTVVEGAAHHELVGGSGRRRWQEATARIFATFVRRRCGRRASISLGARSLDTIDLDAIGTICTTLALPDDGHPSEDPAGVILEPWVAASFVRALADNRIELRDPLRVVQQPEDGMRDGRGSRPRRLIVRRDRDPWPGCFRPSFRFPPAFTPLHVALLGTSAPVSDAAHDTVVALASRWVTLGPMLRAMAWIRTREGHVALRELAVDPSSLRRPTIAAYGDLTWYPEGAGAWGERLILRMPAARLRPL